MNTTRRTILTPQNKKVPAATVMADISCHSIVARFPRVLAAAAAATFPRQSENSRVLDELFTYAHKSANYSRCHAHSPLARSDDVTAMLTMLMRTHRPPFLVFNARTQAHAALNKY